jgi:hypothetical protein
VGAAGAGGAALTIATRKPASTCDTARSSSGPAPDSRFEAGHDDDLALIACSVCGKSPGQTTCTPLVVSGEVIGSVLVEHAEPLRELERQRVTQSVAQVAPVIANMRNLAIAEHRRRSGDRERDPRKRLRGAYRRRGVRRLCSRHHAS